ncbi:MAG TPA: hypothetical protein VFT22_10925 [Kofleriaceae bacterium]|nr:hypothetical protein [Kofleriaceae bacterium]
MPKPEKLKTLPPAWERIHRRSAGQLLMAEAKTLGLMQAALRREVTQVVAQLALLPSDNQSFLRRRAIMAIRHATPMLGQSVETAIRQGRQHGRDAAHNQLLAELNLVRVELEHLGIPQEDHPDDPNATAQSDDPKHDEDDMAAHAAATSFAASWGTRALAKVLAWSDDPSGSLAAKIHKTIPEVDSRVRLIATTETSRAFSDEHDEGVGYVAEQHASSPWAPALFRVWNAINDRRTCAICEGHDGEIVLAGMQFDGGDEPGDVHPSCRCTPSLVFLPLRFDQTKPGHYTGLDDDEAA